MKIPFSQIEEAIIKDDGIGFCLEYGNEQTGCEPDAREIICEACEQPRVFGAEEILMMDEVDTSK